VLQQVLRKFETDAVDMKRKGMSFPSFKNIHAMLSFKLAINCILLILLTRYTRVIDV
jgi:hypothetical protein